MDRNGGEGERKEKVGRTSTLFSLVFSFVMGFDYLFVLFRLPVCGALLS